LGKFFEVLVKVTTIPAVAGLIEKITGKLLPGENSGVRPKVTAALAPAAFIELALFIVQYIDPGLYAILDASRAALLEIAAVVGLIVAYYTPDDNA
jgi:hypothetical protein